MATFLLLSLLCLLRQAACSRRTAGAKKCVVLYPGAFNPPGLHHIQMVEALLGQPGVASVVMMPARKSPDKVTAPLADRVELCRLSVTHHFPAGSPVEVDGDGLEFGEIMRDFSLLKRRFLARFGDSVELAVAYGADKSRISQRDYEASLLGRLFFTDNLFFVVERAQKADDSDFRPARHVSLPEPAIRGAAASSTLIRQIINDCSMSREEQLRTLENLLVPAAIAYMLERRLFREAQESWGGALLSSALCND